MSKTIIYKGKEYLFDTQEAKKDFREDLTETLDGTLCSYLRYIHFKQANHSDFKKNVLNVLNKMKIRKSDGLLYLLQAYCWNYHGKITPATIPMVLYRLRRKLYNKYLLRLTEKSMTQITISVIAGYKDGKQSGGTTEFYPFPYIRDGELFIFTEQLDEMNNNNEISEKDNNYMNKTNDKPLYPENAYCGIFDEKLDLPPDAAETLEYAVTALPQRESEIFMLRYKDEMTYGEISRKYNVTRERIRQILAMILRKFRSPLVSEIIKAGQERYLSEIVPANEEKMKQYNERIAELYRVIQKQETELAEYSDKLNTAEKQADPMHHKLNTSIDALDLSARSFNSLTDAGVKTVHDVIYHEDLLEIRNLGLSSYKEIQDKLKAFIKADSEENYIRQ